MKKFFRKYMILFLILFLLLDALLIYFTFFGFTQKSKEVNLADSEDAIIEKIKVDYDVIGNPMPKVDIVNLENTTELVNTTAGKIGDAFDISGDFSNSQLKEAKVTIEYNADNLPEGTDPNDLVVMWYNEKTNKMVEMKTKVDPEDETITFTTKHFSQYVIVNRSVWEEAWKKEIAKIREEDSKFSVEFIVDDSGSMSSNDKDKKRLDATKSAVYALSDKDRYLIMKFSSGSEVVQEFTNDASKAEDALNQFKSSGDTNIVGAVKEGIHLFENEKAKNYRIIILLTDGEDSSLSSNVESLVELAAEAKATIFTIGLKPSGSTLNFSVIKDLAEKTGGKFYEIDETSLAYIFLDITNAVVGVDGELDGDKDGIPDGIEISGMRNQFGEMIYTFPYTADSDGDGISDKDEIGKLKKDKDGNLYYEMISNPRDDTNLPIDGRIVGPIGTEDVHDSGFRYNVNGFSFSNFELEGQAGFCAGMASVTEKVYNSLMPIYEDTYGWYLSRPYFKTLIETKALYGYKINHPQFELPTEDNYIAYPILESRDELKNKHDKEIISEIVANYNQVNGIDFEEGLEGGLNYFVGRVDYTVHQNNLVTKKQIEKIEKIFDNGKIITINIERILCGGRHAINGYAIERMDAVGNEYRLYVYDNNYPYNPYLIEDTMEGNTYVTLKKNCDGDYTFQYAPSSNAKKAYASNKGGAISFTMSGEYID